MAKLNKTSDDQSGRGNRKTGAGKSDKEGGGYKKKRSFTKNKDFRSKKNESGRGFRKDDRKKEFGGERAGYRDIERGGEKKRRFEGFERKPLRKPSDKRESSFRDKKNDDTVKRTHRHARPEGGDSERRPFRKDADSNVSGYRERSGDREQRPRDREREGERKPFKRDSDKRSSGFRERSTDRDVRPRENDRRGDRDNERKPFGFRERKEEEKRFGEPRNEEQRERRGDRSEKPAGYAKDNTKEDKFEAFRKAVRKGTSDKNESAEEPKRRLTKPRKDEDQETKRVKYDDFEEGRAFSKSNRDKKAPAKTPKKGPEKKQQGEGLIRLNKYLSNAGIASRREADNLIQSGTVKVNGVVIDQLGYKISPGDKVTYGDAAVKSERKVYLLLNKPKDYITTVDDPRERKTVMELIKGACHERVYPVGRLDRNTTGILLFTNDGELTTRLTHPRFGVKKVYHVTLNKGLKPADFSAIIEGVELEDGIVKADDLAFVGEGKKDIGIEIHSGRNRVVRRLFEHLGYDVLKLDRVVFAGLTKKDLPRGKYRFLTAKEVSFLQMIG